MLKRKVGDVSPSEYDWRAQFGEISGTDGYVPMDAGKVHGLAVALDEAEARLAQANRLLRWVRPFSPNDGTIRSEIEAFLQGNEHG